MEQKQRLCWEDMQAWTRDELGYDSWLEVFALPSAACLLPKGHDGPHVWTPNKPKNEEATP